MSKKRDIRISQCMIVKNEEKNIERALSWGKDIMWEQIVVDTGSTDHTVEIARRMGAKVFFLEWQDDFAAAKNYAIDRAQGEWIVFLDADEYMVNRDAGRIPDILENSGSRFDVFMTGCEHIDDEGKIFMSGTLYRIFRNTPDIRYKRRIHEHLVHLGGQELRFGDIVNCLSIFHTGYQTKASAEQKKDERNKRLIRKELEDHPDDHEMMGYMGDACSAPGERAEAEGWYRRAVAHMPSQLRNNDQRSAETFSRLLIILAEKKGASWKDQENIYSQAVRLLPQEADFDYIAGRFFAAKDQPDQALLYLEKALEKLETYGCVNKSARLAGNLADAYGLLAGCCYKTGSFQKCVVYAVNYLRYDRYEMKILSYLLKALLPENSQSESQEAVIGFLSKLYDFSLPKDCLFLIKTAEISDRQDFSAFMCDHFLTPEEQKLLGL